MNKTELIQEISDIRAELAAISKESPADAQEFNLLRHRFDRAQFKLSVAQTQLMAMEMEASLSGAADGTV